MRIGIVTGASSGMGAQFARKIDSKMGLDEIWLIARRRQRLENLATELKTPCVCLSLDLSSQDDISRLQARLEQSAPSVAVLVCAAGFGKFAKTQDLSMRDQNRMIAVNCTAAVDVTALCIPYLERYARVIEIASSASFQPLPGLNVYAATKAFLRSYTRALRWELFSKRIRATAVCPWWVDTEFEQVAREEGGSSVGNIVKTGQSAKSVVAWSFAANGIGLAVATCNPISFIMRVCGKLLPSCVIMTVWEGLRRI